MGVRRLCVSFSGGETSALMAKLVLERMRPEYDEIACLFANTGQENEATLRFVQRCDETFSLGVIWVEADVAPQRGEGTRARVVDFTTADRTGGVFEAMIDKYGIPNTNYPHCTRELKGHPIRAYLRSRGWPVGSYDTAIGIRIDEIDRCSPTAKDQRLIYPLISRFPHRKIDVNAFWERQPFRLELKGYEGNCMWCWKKSLRKHLTIVAAHPERYDFPERMEREKGEAGAGTGTRVFFRGPRSTAEIRRLAMAVPFVPASDDARQYQPDLFPLFDPELDVGAGCEESCEVEFPSPTPQNERVGR